MRFTESSVRAAIFTSLEGTLNHELTLYFDEKMGVTTIAETLRQLDIRFQRLTQHETNSPLSSFVESERRPDESLQSWVARYRSLYQRAAAPGYVPASDISDTLMRKSQISAQAHGEFIGEFRKKEDQLKRVMTPAERHSFLFGYLQQIAALLRHFA